MELNVPFRKRIKQLFCRHNGTVGWSCCSKGINNKEGYWRLTYSCHNCGFSHGEWIKADDKLVDELFEKDKYKIQ